MIVLHFKTLGEDTEPCLSRLLADKVTSARCAKRLPTLLASRAERAAGAACAIDIQCVLASRKYGDPSKQACSG